VTLYRSNIGIRFIPIVFWVCSCAFGGKIIVVGADPGSPVGIGVKYTTGGKLITAGNADKNGIISFDIPDQGHIKIDVVCGDVKGKTTYVENSFSIAPCNRAIWYSWLLCDGPKQHSRNNSGCDWIHCKPEPFCTRSNVPGYECIYIADTCN
jgi:hypothetical protein